MPDPSPRPLRMAMAAAILEVHPRTVQRWCNEGRLKYIRLPYGPRERRIDFADCLRLRASYAPDPPRKVQP